MDYYVVFYEVEQNVYISCFVNIISFILEIFRRAQYYGREYQ